MAVTKPPVTRVAIPSNKFGVGRSARISQVSEHHIVGDAQAVINKAKGSAIFSTTYTIAMDGTIYQLVEDSNTPYCDNAWQSNSRALTIEHAGGLAGYPYTEAMYQSSIKLHAWFFQTYGNLNCVRHRDIPEIKADPAKATACPGGLDVERIVREAKSLLQGGEDMITENDRDYLRILHSEAGGWDLQKTHAGEYDKLFMDVYKGKDFRELIGAQWKNGGGFRDYRQKAIQFYEQYKDKINQMAVEDDEPQIKEALAELAQLETKAKAVQAKLNEAIND